MRFGVAGLGRIGAVHARNVALHPRAMLAAVYDPDTRRAESIVEEAGCSVAASFEAMLSDGLVDAVIVASSTELARVRRGAVGWIEMISFFGKDPEPPHSDFIPTSGGIFRHMMIHDVSMRRATVRRLGDPRNPYRRRIHPGEPLRYRGGDHEDRVGHNRHPDSISPHDLRLRSGIEVHGSEGMRRTENHATSSASRDRRPSSCASTLPRWLTRVCLQDLHWLSMNNEWPANAFAVIWSPIAKTQSE
jgi:hypothetical protein